MGCGSLAAEESQSKRARVQRVVDGDTLVLAGGDRVRLLGVDTPESVKPDTPPECGSHQAARSLTELAQPGATIRITTDPASGDTRDQYGRLLAFVSLRGHDLGLIQIRRGWAEVYAFQDREFAKRDRYERAARVAERRGVGVHRICSGQR